MKRLSILCAMLLFLIGCGKSFEPRAIEPEVDVCDVCNMSIVHEEYATQVILKNGDYHVYDDIGCMYEYMEDDIEVSYVKDLVSNEWIKSDDAFYVYDPSAWTPMAYGILSFKEEKSALAHLEKEPLSTKFSIADLTSHSWVVSNYE